jgi:hypothetical protein
MLASSIHLPVDTLAGTSLPQWFRVAQGLQSACCFSRGPLGISSALELYDPTPDRGFCSPGSLSPSCASSYFIKGVLWSRHFKFFLLNSCSVPSFDLCSSNTSPTTCAREASPSSDIPSSQGHNLSPRQNVQGHLQWPLQGFLPTPGSVGLITSLKY